MLSDRARNIPSSVTLKLNEKAGQMTEKGMNVYNLTAGQLPVKPDADLIAKLGAQMNFLKSFQYSPVSGFPDIRKKVIDHVSQTRRVNLTSGEGFDCILSNGGKHSLFNVMGAILDPDDEVVVLAPYWLSYPEIVKLWGGVPVIVRENSYGAFTPTMADIEKAISPKTKAIIINSPNNPSGIHYPDAWMKEFAHLLRHHPDVVIVSDEIYFHLNYYDPAPTYFYQHDASLLSRTIIVDGISKSMSCTGLRMGFTLAPKSVISAMSKLQAQTASGANSLVQRALVDYDFSRIPEFLAPMKHLLRLNAKSIRDAFESRGLSSIWYQTTSAFYFIVDLGRAPIFANYAKQGGDQSTAICDALLEKTGVVVVPTSDFGLDNAMRISLVLEEKLFAEAMGKVADFLMRTE